MSADQARRPSAPTQPKAAPARGGGPRRYLALLVGWVLVPMLVAAGVVASGVHQGAHAPDAWYTRAVRFIVATLAG